MSAGKGTPSEDHPARVARDLGLTVPGGQVSWSQLLDVACDAYWKNRPAQSPRALEEYRRRQKRRVTAAEVWLRRAGAA